jgi:succinoglycan biosynthesis transport protein ExoP
MKAEQPMNSTDLRYYFSILLRRLPLFLAIALPVTGLGVVYAMTRPSVFRATSTILVESPQVPSDLARSSVPENTWSRFQTIQQELMTRESLLAMAKRLKVYPSGTLMTDTKIVEDLRDRIALAPTFYNGDQSALSFAISFDAEKPVLAARVANDLADTILERDADSRASRAAETLKFFDEEAARLAQGVAEIEKRIQAYKLANLDALPDSLEFRRAQQGNQQDRLLILEREESSLRSRRAAYLQLYQNTGLSLEGAAASPEQKLLEDLQAALLSQRAMFSEDSPSILTLQARIDKVKADLKAKPGDANGTVPTEMHMQLNDIDDSLEAIAQEKVSIERKFTQLSASIKATPANETALQSLEREHTNELTRYNAAVARLAEASTGEQIETRFKGERLSLLEAASPPESPVRSKRLILALGGVAVGVGLGIAVILALELLGARVRRSAQLQRGLNIEPIATIPYVFTRAQLRKRRLLMMAAIVLFIAAMPLVQLVLARNDIMIGDIVQSAFARVGAIIS